MVGGIENEGESMPRTRKSHPPSLKAKVAVEAIKAHRTTAQIAQMFAVHPTQVGGWKKQALAGLPDIFGNGREQVRQQSDLEKDELYNQLDELYLKCPFYGSRKMAVVLEVNRKRAQRLMRILGIEALYPKPNLSRPAPGHEIYPYLLRGVSIERPNQVWSTDITYIPMRPTRNLELRSGVPVHLARLSGAAEEARHLDQYGWTGPCPGQRFYRAP